MKILHNNFFAKDAHHVAQFLLGKVLRVRYDAAFLSAIIIETEAYFINDKASHASLGFTQARKALFMAPGTIYMYHSRGGDSLNISCLGEGNGVLIKSAYPYVDAKCHPDMLSIMRSRHTRNTQKIKSVANLCNGQALLCKSLGLKIKDWNQKHLSKQDFFIEDIGYRPKAIIQTTRLGIALTRDAHLPNRYVDRLYAKYCTKNPLSRGSALCPKMIM